MNRKILLLISLVLSGSVFADSDHLVKQEKTAIKSYGTFDANIKLKSVSPMIYDVVTDITRQKQLNEIKILLQKIVDNQKCDHRD